MGDEDLLRAFKPKHDKLLRDDVMLNWCTIVGTMQSGKTTTAKTLIHLINKRYASDGDVRSVNLQCFHFNDVFNLHLDEELSERVRCCDIINLLVDDAASGLSSKRYSHETEVNWFRIRHYFHEDLGVRRATLNVFFAIQRYMNLQNIVRNSPVLIFKAVPVTDVNEKKLLGSILGPSKWKLLNDWCYEVFIKGNIKRMSQNMIKILNRRAYVQEVPPNADGEEFHTLPHLEGDKDKPWLGAVLHVVSRMHGIPVERIAEEAGIPPATAYRRLKLYRSKMGVTGEVK